MVQRIKSNRLAFCFMIFLCLLTGCGGNSSAPSSASEMIDARNSDGKHLAGTASNQCLIRYATGFTISYHGNYKVVTVFEPCHAPGSKRMATFVLIPRGTRQSMPIIPVKGTVVEIPVQRVVLRSASHASFFSLLGVADRIVGIVQGKFVNDPEVTELFHQRQIAEVGVGTGMEAQFDMERLFSLHPDLVLSWWTNNPAYAAHIKTQGAGLPVALIADTEENSPLGRAEWIKFVASFFDAEAKAERIFDDIERRYSALAARTRNIHHQPTVMNGASYRGSWFVAGGKSCFANLVRDAGGQYIWTDDYSSSSRPVNAETVMIRGRNAEYWLTQKQNLFSMASLAAEDNRYTLFRSFQSKRIYSNNGKIGPGGGNDYYQGTATRPDLLLADMIAILHPELLPDHKLIWHLHLPPTLSNGTDDSGVRKK